MELIFGFAAQFILPVLIIIGGLLAAWGWGKSKEQKGVVKERERATVARDNAAKEAVVIRDSAKAKPIDQQRKSVQEWEQ